MITTHTETSAAGKLCPLTQSPNQSNCCGSQCMAWQWAAPDNLEQTAYLPANPDGWCHEEPAKSQAPALDKFKKPLGAGWHPAGDGVYVSDDDDHGFIFVVDWVRDSDPERQGYCAALPQPLAIRNKLDDLIENLVLWTK